MLKKYLMTIVAAAALIAEVAYASPPLVDYQWTVVVEGEDCVAQAKNAMGEAGFSITAKDKESIVGIKEDYKAVVACLTVDRADVSGEEDSLSKEERYYSISVFLVSGPHYKMAKELSIELKDNF